MKDGKELATAIQITATAFVAKLDKGGFPYILHCLTVMERVGKITQKNSIAMQIAVMHDLLEDIPEWTKERLRNAGFCEEVIAGVVRMTHQPGESYQDYIERITECPMCIIIKMCDLKHNMDPTRMKGIREKDKTRTVKYLEAYHYLDNIRSK